MPNFEVLGSLMKNLHQEFTRIYYLMLPVCFALSIAITWFKHPQGSIEFLDVLKRAFVSTLLLAMFPEVASSIVFIADGIAEKIDNLSGLDTIIKMAKLKAESYSLSPKSLLLGFNDLILATLSFLSYLLLYVSRYITIAMYYFFWTLLTVLAPILMLFNLFPSTSHITANLFRGMIEVASWKIIWAVLSAMLASLSFGDVYKVEGNYLTLIVMNFVIALAMLFTPLIVRSLVGQGVQTAAAAIGPATAAAIIAAPARVITAKTMSTRVVQSVGNYARSKIPQFKPKTKQS